MHITMPSRQVTRAMIFPGNRHTGVVDSDERTQGGRDGAVDRGAAAECHDRGCKLGELVTVIARQLSLPSHFCPSWASLGSVVAIAPNAHMPDACLRSVKSPRSTDFDHAPRPVESPPSRAFRSFVMPARSHSKTPIWFKATYARPQRPGSGRRGGHAPTARPVVVGCWWTGARQ